MRSLYQVIFSLFLCQALMGAQSDSPWEREILALQKGIPNSVALNDVFEDLQKWDPDQAWYGTQTVSWFRDRYLHDESFTDLIRANYIPWVMNVCYEGIMGEPLQCVALEDAVRTCEMGKELLRLGHNVPYISCANQKSDVIFTKAELCKHASVLCSHGSMLLSHRSSLEIQNITTFFGAIFLSGGLKLVSLGFLMAAGYFSATDEYIDVALRSIEREYAKIHRANESHAIILHMMTRRALKKAQKDNLGLKIE